MPEPDNARGKHPLPHLSVLKLPSDSVNLTKPGTFRASEVTAVMTKVTNSFVIVHLVLPGDKVTAGFLV